MATYVSPPSAAAAAAASSSSPAANTTTTPLSFSSSPVSVVPDGVPPRSVGLTAAAGIAASTAVSTSLCAVERMVELSTQTPADFEVQETLRFDEAVNMALVACEAVSPYDRFRLIETPDENFLLVTNVIPREPAEMPAVGAEAERTFPTRHHDVLDGFSNLSVPLPPPCGVRDYALHNVDRLTYEGELVYGSYVLYRKNHVELSLSSNKAQYVETVLRNAYTPGLLDHHNVCDIEGLLYLLYCGPRSFCSRDTCFGREKHGCPFPALLPKLFYEPVRDYMTYMNLAELYVYVWYRGYDFPSASDSSSGGDDDELRLPLKAVSLDRLKEVLKAVRGRFVGREVPTWPASSRTCLLCALYSQNRLCLDLARDEAKTVHYSPIVIQDCPAAVTDVTLSHILPGQTAVTLFPVYHVGKLLDALTETEAGVVSLNL
ncbi:Cy130 [Cynomolgus cytomegalovirus]|uniref:Protein UL95 n=1 Tax=Cynomolgus macaque cytomegalovirus strain Mauritius TaxID=1690255 RepID=A0A0K1GZP2_9BETA|nr:protein UL95 [Cynomolgus macaque cytomegalovirus strain Mauritius]APT39297.1 Cy130 [Cynomolgus cytomegalovirus]APT39486.1 Cy130 [Cynomolgus cytomegalovirus]AXG21833.1 protein UL95 [synthetic construct]AXG22100.1 protein UL95 [synthetic construct]